MQVAFFGMILHRARRYDESIAQCKKALEINPNYPNALWFLALSLEQTGQLEKSMAQLEKAVSLSGEHYWAGRTPWQVTVTKPKISCMNWRRCPGKSTFPHLTLPSSMRDWAT